MRFNLAIWLYQGEKWKLNTEARREAYFKKGRNSKCKGQKDAGGILDHVL